MEKTIFTKFSNLKWWQTTIMICSILISGGFAAYMGANVSFNMNIEWRIQELEQRQNATELLLSTEINSSVSALSKLCSYLISIVDSYAVMQRGNDSKTEYWNTNLTKVEEFAIGNLTNGGLIWLKECQWNSLLNIPTNVIVWETYQGKTHYYTQSGTGKIGDCPITVEGTYQHSDGVTEQTIFEVVPSITTFIYNLYFDFSNLTQDSTLKIYEKIDNSNYVELPKCRLFIGSSERYGMLMKQIMFNTPFKITLTSSIAEGVSRNIYYRYFKEEW